MVGVWILLILFFLGMTVVLFVGTAYFQAYIYSEPVPALTWRAPVTAGVLTLYLALVGWLEVRAPNTYDTLFVFTPRENIEVDEFISVLRGQEQRFRRSRTTKTDFMHVANPREKWRPSVGEHLVEEIRAQVPSKGGGGGATEVVFKVELTPDRKFKPTGPAYRAGDGRVMTGEYVGTITRWRWGLFFVNLLLNLGYLLVWFLLLWLVLRYQWSHALGLAVPIWILLMLTLLPSLFLRARQAAEARKPVALLEHPQSYQKSA